MNAENRETSQTPEFENLVSSIIAGSKDCQCRQHGACPYPDSEGCHRIDVDSGSIRILQNKHDDYARCLYLGRYSCCWVLETVEKLALYYLDKQGVSAPPVPSHLINCFDAVRRVEVRPVPLKSLHGALWLADGDWVIHLNESESSRMKRFIIFHEAFHIIYRNARLQPGEASLEHDPCEETIASHFADSLLMPRKWVEERWGTVRDTRRMAKVFEVCVSTMARRLRQLNLLPAVS